MSGFGHPVRFPGTHEDQTEVRRQRCVMRINSIEREIVTRRKFDHLGTGRRQLLAQNVML
jgi:hypothetical protein